MLFINAGLFFGNFLLEFVFIFICIVYYKGVYCMCALNVLTIANKTGSMIAKSLPKVADAGQNLSKG